jgi:hypothetical protein
MVEFMEDAGPVEEVLVMRVVVLVTVVEDE